jgi:hypothetical protein
MGVDIAQSATGGLAGTTEKRILDWEWQDHSDYIFGSVRHRSRLIGGIIDEQGLVRPSFDLLTEPKDQKIADFLCGKITADGKRSEGFLADSTMSGTASQEGSWIHVFAKNEHAGWTAEQVILSCCTSDIAGPNANTSLRYGALRSWIISVYTLVVWLLPITKGSL